MTPHISPWLCLEKNQGILPNFVEIAPGREFLQALLIYIFNARFHNYLFSI